MTDDATTPEGTTEADDELVRWMVLYQAGAIEGFERLYGVLEPDVRRFLARGLQPAESVADLVQEAFLEMHRSRRSYQPPLPVRPWVIGIARNILHRHRRRAWRRVRHEQPDADPAAEADRRASAPHPAPIDVGDVEGALGRLPERPREAWLLHHVHGLSFRQIADRLGIGVGAAKLRSSRAMRALRLALRIEDRDE